MTEREKWTRVPEANSGEVSSRWGVPTAALTLETAMPGQQSGMPQRPGG